MDISLDELRNYKLIITDMDGTLYSQKHLRRIMGFSMLKYALSHREGLSEIRIILCFRKKREGWTGRVAEDQPLYQEVAAATGKSAAYIKDVVEKWIYRAPLSHLRPLRNEQLSRSLLLMQEEGIQVVIYSDYPAQEKAKALELDSLVCFSGNQPEINSLKPNPSGINYIMSKYRIQNKEDVLLIGDRPEKDGLAALQAGINYKKVRCN